MPFTRSEWLHLTCLGLIVGLCCGDPIRAQVADAPPPPAVAVEADDGGWLGLNTSSFTSRRSLLTLGLAGLASAWIWEETDERFDQIQSALGRSRLDPALDIGNIYGNGLVIGGSAVSLSTIGYLANKPGLQAFGGDLGRSFLYSGAVTWALKLAVNRERPSGSSFSFPSGHTTSAFSAVPVVWHHAGWIAGCGASLMAATAGLGRMEENRHYVSDVLFGAALGMVFGWAVIEARPAMGLAQHMMVTGNALALQWQF